MIEDPQIIATAKGKKSPATGADAEFIKNRCAFALDILADQADVHSVFVRTPLPNQLIRPHSLTNKSLKRLVNVAIWVNVMQRHLDGSI